MERLYPKNAWVTPSELFKPYYGFTIANFMINQMENRGIDILRIVEIGPGTGTLADSILEFYKNYSLELYRKCEYILVEISPQLSEKCEQTLSQNHRRLYENDQIKIYNSSILDFNKPFNEACFVIGMEILDNMPHDRLFADEVPKDGSRIKYTK